MMETGATLSKKVAELEQDKQTQAFEILKLKKRVKKLKKKRKSKHSGLKRLKKFGTSQRVESSADTIVGDMDAELQGRIDDVSAAIKDANVVEPTVFDDEEVTMTMAQTLIKMKAKKARLLDEQMAKRLHDEEVEQNTVVKPIQEKHLDIIRKYQSLKRKPVSIAQARKNMIIYLKNINRYKMEHFRGMTYEKVRPIFEREYKKVQTLFKPDKDEETTKKKVAEEILLQEKDVQNMLEIIPVSEFKVEALKVKYPLIDWESEGSRSYWKIIRVGGITEAYQSFKEILKGFDKEDLDALWRLIKEKFSLAVLIVDKENALWVEIKRLIEPDADDVNINNKRHDMFMLIEKNYPLSNGVITLMLSAKLQVEEENDMARDLVMKIFMEANKPKSRSLDTSSRDYRAKGNHDSRRRDVRYNGNKTRDNGRRPAYQDDSKALVTIDGEDITGLDMLRKMLRTML
nr:hypothetical protein [Tanacetum cinerariifolium]